jgi:hypothetical protein
MTPTKAQQQQIEAMLGFMLGAEVYDQVFSGVVCGNVDNKTVSLFVDNEDRARLINTEYSWHVAVIVESILKAPVRFVNVVPREARNAQAR